jgi:hypothetical protein
VAVLGGIVALLAAIASGLGIFFRGDGTAVQVVSERGVPYAMATTGVYAYNDLRVVAEGVGWDIVTMFLAAPALAVAAIFVARGSFRARLVAAGLFGYFFYQYLEYSVTWAFGPLFGLFVAIYAASLAGMVWLGSCLAGDADGRFSDQFPRRSWASLNLVMAFLLVLLWTRRIASGLSGDLSGAGITSETTMTVQALDLGIVVPAALLAAVLAWRRRTAGYVIGAAFSVTFVALAVAIVGMLLSAWVVEGALELVPIVIFGSAAAAGAVIGIHIYRSVTHEVDLRDTQWQNRGSHRRLWTGAPRPSSGR